MDITVNLKNLKTPEQIQAYATFKSVEKETEELAKKLQGKDDQVNIDFNPNKGELAVSSVNLEGQYNTKFTGYEKFDPATGKMEELNVSGEEKRSDDGYFNCEKSNYKYNENDTKKEYSQDKHYTSGRSISGSSWENNVLLEIEKHGTFTVDKKTGDIHCKYSEIRKGN